MTKAEVLDYVMTTPKNTNRQVLSYMLDDLESGGGSDVENFVINITGYIPEAGEDLTLDKTYTEIREAVRARKNIFANVSGHFFEDGHERYLPASSIFHVTNIPSSNDHVFFRDIKFEDGIAYIYQIEIDTEWEHSYFKEFSILIEEQ